mgnify:CR=1 FL=1
MKSIIWLLPFLLLLACSSGPTKTLHLDEDAMSEVEFATPVSPRKPAKTSAKEKTSSEIPAQGKDCRSPVGFIAHGQSMSFYRNSRVPEGFDCEKESRTCIDGELSGTFAFSSCMAVP